MLRRRDPGLNTREGLSRPGFCCEAAPHDRTEDSSAQQPANLTAAGFKGRPHTRTLKDPLQTGFSRNLRPWQLSGC